MPVATSSNVVSSCQFDDHRTRVSPTSPLSGVTSSSLIKSPLSSAANVDCAKVHTLSDLHHTFTPPYVSPAARRLTAAVAPSLSRTLPSQTSASLLQLAGSPSLRYPSSVLQQRPSLPASVFSPKTTQSLPRVMSDAVHRFVDGTSVSKSPAARSLLAPSSAVCSGISYSLALSSTLSASSRSFAAQTNTSNLSMGLPFPRTADRLYSANSLSTNQEQQDSLLREYTSGYIDHTSGRQLPLSSPCSDFYSMPQRTASASSVVTTVSHTTYASGQLHRVHLSRYPYHAMNRTSQSATAQYLTGPFPSCSAATVSTQLLQSNSGRCTCEIAFSDSMSLVASKCNYNRGMYECMRQSHISGIFVSASCVWILNFTAVTDNNDADDWVVHLHCVAVLWQNFTNVAFRMVVKVAQVKTKEKKEDAQK